MFDESLSLPSSYVHVNMQIRKVDQEILTAVRQQSSSGSRARYRCPSCISSFNTHIALHITRYHVAAVGVGLA